MYRIDPITLLSDAVLAQSGSKTTPVVGNLRAAGVVGIYGHLRNDASATGGGAARKIATVVANIELEPGAGYISLTSGTPAQGVSFDAAGVVSLDIDLYGRFTLFPAADGVQYFAEHPFLDVASLKFTITKAASPTENAYLDLVLYIHRVLTAQNYDVTTTGSWA